MKKACQTISLPRPVSIVKIPIVIIKWSPTLLSHLKFWLIAKIYRLKELTITAQKDGTLLKSATTAKMASANGNGETNTRTTVLLTTHRGLQLRLTVCQEPPLPLMFMSLLLLRTPLVNPLSMKCNRILLMKVRTLITNQKRVMTALAVSMTTRLTRELAWKDRLGFLKNNATIRMQLKFHWYL
jgi:hypothetical protein